MRSYKGESFAKVYKDLLKDLSTNPEYVCAPRDQKINEILNVTLEIENPMSGLYKNSIRGSQYKYIAAEFVFYFAGRNDLKYIQKYAKFWKDIANPDGTVNSAYGHLLFKRYYNGTQSHPSITQWEWAYESLKKDKDTRQALMHFNLPEHQHFGNKDFVCTLNGIFHIRDNKLDFTVMMRSNDAILGLPTDVAFFTMLQQQMYHLLKKDYPELELGKYTHQVNSMHLYERNFAVVEDMLKVDFEEDFIPEIINDLINEKGEMTERMRELHDAVNDGTIFVFPDETPGKGAFDWIMSNIQRTTIKA